MGSVHTRQVPTDTSMLIEEPSGDRHVLGVFIATTAGSFVAMKREASRWFRSIGRLARVCFFSRMKMSIKAPGRLGRRFCEVVRGMSLCEGGMP